MKCTLCGSEYVSYEKKLNGNYTETRFRCHKCKAYYFIKTNRDISKMVKKHETLS